MADVKEDDLRGLYIERKEVKENPIIKEAQLLISKIVDTKLGLTAFILSTTIKLVIGLCIIITIGTSLLFAPSLYKADILLLGNPIFGAVMVIVYTSCSIMMLISFVRVREINALAVSATFGMVIYLLLGYSSLLTPRNVFYIIPIGLLELFLPGLFMYFTHKIRRVNVS
jgi:membrane-associated HD superfamily phosphohydrolase